VSLAAARLAIIVLLALPLAQSGVASALSIASLEPSEGVIGDRVVVRGSTDPNVPVEVYLEDMLVARGASGDDGSFTIVFFIPVVASGVYELRIVDGLGNEASASLNVTYGIDDLIGDLRRALDSISEVLEGEERLEARLNESIGRIEEALDRMDELNRSLSSALEEIDELRSIALRLESRVDQAASDIEGVRDEVEEVSELVADIQGEIDSFIEEARRNFTSVSERMEDLLARLEGLQEFVEEARANFTSITATVEELSELARGLESRVDEALATIEEITRRVDEVTGLAERLEANVNRTIAQIDDITGRINDIIGVLQEEAERQLPRLIAAAAWLLAASTLAALISLVTLVVILRRGR